MRKTKQDRIEQARAGVGNCREEYKRTLEKLSPEARTLLERYDYEGQLTPSGEYGASREEVMTRSKEFGKEEGFAIRMAAFKLESEAEAKASLQRALELPDDPTPEEEQARTRAKARNLAQRTIKKLGLNEEQAEVLIKFLAEAYPDWEKRQPPDVTEDEDAWQEWRDEVNPGEHAENEIERVPVGSVLCPFDESLLKEGNKVAVPDYYTGHIEFVPVERMKKAEWNAVRVGMLAQPTWAELFARLQPMMDRKMELDPNLGPDSPIFDILCSEVEETDDSPASLSEARRKR